MSPTNQYVRVAKVEDGQEIIYSSSCSIGTGISLLVMGCVLHVLGIVELCIPPFVTRGVIFAVAWASVMAGAVGLCAGKKIDPCNIRASLICSTVAAVWNGLWVPGMIGRMIIDLIIIPLANGEGPDYDYTYNHVYFDNGTVAVYDHDPERTPIVRPGDEIDITATATVFALELIFLLAGCIVCIVQAALACSTMCGGVKVKPQATIQLADGTQVPAMIVHQPPQK